MEETRNKCIQIIEADKWGILKLPNIGECDELYINDIVRNVDFSRFSICEMTDILYDALEHNEKNALNNVDDLAAKWKLTNDQKLKDHLHAEHKNWFFKQYYWYKLWNKFIDYYREAVTQEYLQKKEKKRIKKMEAQKEYKRRVNEQLNKQLNKNVAGIITSYLF